MVVCALLTFARPARKTTGVRLMASAGWSDEFLNMRPIGRIESCWKEKFGTPRQGSLAPDSRATLRLDLPDRLHALHTTEGLAEFSHVWLIWAFSLNGHHAANSKVRVPRLRGGRAGIFATRSPFRPNPIGLSLVRLDAVDGRTLALSGVDLVHGTPIIDIKPYVPSYDSPRQSTEVRFASWLQASVQVCLSQGAWWPSGSPSCGTVWMVAGKCAGAPWI